MKQVLWFRRDLRIKDSAILENAKNEVLPIFIFDKNILSKLDKNDKRLTFIYNSVLDLKKHLQTIGLDLAIFYDEPINVFKLLKKENFDEVLCSVDFDSYSKYRDEEIERVIPLKRFIDSFIIDPKEHFKKDGNPYKIFTPFYKSLNVLTSSNKIEERKGNKNLKLVRFDYSYIPKIEDLGFVRQKLPSFLLKNPIELLKNFKTKIDKYEKDRDFFYKNASSKLSVHLRFGLISPVQIFNFIRSSENSEVFIKELFWREFYNYILYHFPKSEFENFNKINITWNKNENDFKKWCEGSTGIPIIDAAMIHLNKTGQMHNRLRMIVASFLTKNLFIDWRWGEKYFASKLLDYEASSNIGSWQWCASTGADAAPYFRIFNPYTQSEKFDKEGKFIKNVISSFNLVDPKLLHIENSNSIVDIKLSRKIAIEKFKRAKDESS